MPILFDFIEDRLCLVGGQDSCFTSAALDRDGPNATTATSRLAVDVHHLRKVDVVLLGWATALAFFLNNAGFRKYPSRATARAGHTAATTCVAVSGNSFVGRLSSFQGLLPAFCHFQCPDSLLDAQLVAHHDVHLLHVRVLHLGKLLLRNTMLLEGLDGCTTYCCHPKEILHLLDVCRRHSLLSRSWHGGETSQINWDRIRSTYWAVTAAEPRRAQSDNLIIFFAEVKLTQNCWNMLHKNKWFVMDWNPWHGLNPSANDSFTSQRVYNTFTTIIQRDSHLPLPLHIVSVVFLGFNTVLPWVTCITGASRIQNYMKSHGSNSVLAFLL